LLSWADVEFTPIEEDERAAERKVDEYLYESARFIIESKFASTAQLQQRFSVGHPRAVRIMKQLEEFGVVDPHEGTNHARSISISLPSNRSPNVSAARTRPTSSRKAHSVRAVRIS